jgi:hypothetical protein
MRPIVLREFKKVSSTEKFDFKFNPSGWAIVFIDDETGVVSMQTDWGNYSYRWGSPGGPLKEFLLKCDASYLIGKFAQGERDYFDQGETRKECLKRVLEKRRFRWITSSEAREAYDEVKKMDLDSPEAVFYTIQDQAPTFYEKVLCECSYDLPIIKDYSPRVVGFFREVWPLIKHQLRESL